jgi:hypothetical protein
MFVNIFDTDTSYFMRCWLNNIRHSVYDSIKYLTYIQFILPYESEETLFDINVEENSNNTQVVKKIEYEDKYKTDLLKYSEYLRKDEDIIDLNRWVYLKNNILLENTPLGNVIIYYDSVKDTFCYYSDRIIPYKYIDTVCRKYVIRFQCVQLYFDITNNTISNMDVKKEDIIEKEKERKGNNNNIFVKLKSYNKSNKGDSLKSSEINNCINRYTYEGKLMNFNMLQKPEKKKFSYLDFKKTVK